LRKNLPRISNIQLVNLAKRLTENQKKEISQYFTNGKSIEFLTQNYNCTKLTIIRNLKKYLGESKYKKIISVNKQDKDLFTIKEERFNKDLKKNKNIQNSNKSDYFPTNTFVEIKPIDTNIDESSRRDLSSIPIAEFDFPKIVYLIINNNIELEIKLLKEYPDWQFLPEDDLERKTLKVFFDINSAKNFCKKDQKVIKVPNTNVFNIVAPILLSRGITRIVSDEKLIAL